MGAGEMAQWVGLFIHRQTDLNSGPTIYVGEQGVVMETCNHSSVKTRGRRIPGPCWIPVKLQVQIDSVTQEPGIDERAKCLRLISGLCKVFPGTHIPTSVHTHTKRLNTECDPSIPLTQIITVIGTTKEVGAPINYMVETTVVMAFLKVSGLPISVSWCVIQRPWLDTKVRILEYLLYIKSKQTDAILSLPVTYQLRIRINTDRHTDTQEFVFHYQDSYYHTEAVDMCWENVSGRKCCGLKSKFWLPHPENINQLSELITSTWLTTDKWQHLVSWLALLCKVSWFCVAFFVQGAYFELNLRKAQVLISWGKSSNDWIKKYLLTP